MTNNILNDADQIKAILVKTKGTPTQKLLAILLAAGVETTAELAALLELKPRAIQAAKRTTMRAPQCVSALQCAQLNAQTHHNALLARVEYNNITTIDYKEVSEVSTPLVPQAVEIEAPAIAEPTSKRRQGTHLADDWELPDDWRDWTRTNCPASTAERLTIEAMKFANYWQALPGAKGRKVDWFKTWKNWSLTAFGTTAVRPNSQAYVSPWEQEKAAKHERARALAAHFGGGV
jgi:hypothetical protein